MSITLGPFSALRVFSTALSLKRFAQFLRGFASSGGPRQSVLTDSDLTLQGPKEKRKFRIHPSLISERHLPRMSESQVIFLHLEFFSLEFVQDLKNNIAPGQQEEDKDEVRQKFLQSLIFFPRRRRSKGLHKDGGEKGGQEGGGSDQGPQEGGAGVTDEAHLLG